MAQVDFKFIETYRTLAPSASREIIEARQKGHDKLYPLFAKTMTRVYDACCLAFQLPQNSSSVGEWFEKPVKEFDPQFSIEHDKAEAGRIASLLLRDLLSRKSPQGAFAILICSYSGGRTAVDGDLVLAAHAAVTEAARERRVVLAEKTTVAPPGKDLTPELDAIQPAFNQGTTRAAFDAVIADMRNGIAKTALSATEAHQSLRTDVIRLAEEVDMLWWHIGDWSETLGRPRTGVPQQALGIASGVELGDFVRQVPGPYGAYGILRRSLGATSDAKINLKDAVSSLGEDVTKFAAELPQSAMPVFPVHAAMRLAAERGRDGWDTAFGQVAGDVKDFTLSHFELAVQAFRERVLIRHSGFGQ